MREALLEIEAFHDYLTLSQVAITSRTHSLVRFSGSRGGSLAVCRACISETSIQWVLDFDSDTDAFAGATVAELLHSLLAFPEGAVRDDCLVQALDKLALELRAAGMEAVSKNAPDCR